MKCITSPGLDDSQIISYLEGEADDVVVAHIKECPFCSERANRWTLLQNSLRKQLYRVTCPTPMELGDYHLGLLPAPQALVVAQHLRECPLCRREVAELENFLDDLAPEVSLLGAAKVLIARLMGGQTESEKQGKNGFLPSGVALRGEAKGPITLQADGIVIVLDLQQTDGEMINILGQVAAEDQDDWTGANVELQQADQPLLTATLDDLGAFRFEAVRTGSIKFTVTSLSGVVIQTPDIEITA
jgi:hypothetical protein